MLHAACTRQGVACYLCEHTSRRHGHPDGITITSLNNTQQCNVAVTRSGTVYGYHERVIRRDKFWPCRGEFTELYSCLKS